MLVIGLVLLAVAVVAAIVALVQRRRWSQLVSARAYTAAGLRDAAAAGSPGGGGGFAQECEVTGVAQPGPDGPLIASISEVPCVWHRQVVRRRYLRTTTNSKGESRQRRRTEVISDIASERAFTVADDTGTVTVTPAGASVDRPERVHREYEHDPSGGSLTTLGITLRLNDSDGTLGYETEEWVVRPDTRLYVLGGAGDHQGEVGIGKPDRGRFVISTRTKAELTASTWRIQLIAAGVAAVALVAGAATALAGAL